MLKKYFLLFVLVLSCSVFAQQPLRGRIVCNNKINLENTSVTNMSRNSFSVTNREGIFTIEAAVGDVIKFSSVQIKDKTITVKQSDFKDQLLVVTVEPLVEILEEVVVKKVAIDAVSAGILSKPAKKYTPAERRLKAASEFKPKNFWAVPLGMVSLDAIINSISGRTKMLKKEVQIEQREFALQKLNELFQENYFIEKLNIPTEYVNGFKYFAVENQSLRAALKARNKTQTDYILSELSLEYLKNFEQK